MDFFEHQDRARRRTKRLLLYFALAVLLIILAIYGVLVGLFTFSAESATWWQPELLLWVGILTLALISLGSLYKIATLAGGGEAVALMLGARPLAPDTQDSAERRLLNVVEEISIAAGIPPPQVFLLEKEKSINAFAAGWSPSRAVIGITRGALTQLSRAELQGVIAHEFSHILNGDMRLNLRLIGVLHGILLIALIGYMLLHQPARRSGSNKKKDGGAIILLLGLGLMIIGYIGVFFAKLIKSAVARQREFLADAAAVQFTRQPDGLSGALKKIGAGGAQIAHPQAEEASHLFFANGIRPAFLNLLATHPPLAERIRRLEPGFDGVFKRPVTAPSPAESAPAKLTLAAHRAKDQVPLEQAALNATAFARQVGQPQAAHLLYAAALLEALPASMRLAAREPQGARALIYGLLLSQAPEMRQQQSLYLREHSEPALYQALEQLAPTLATLADRLRLPLAELTLPALRTLSKKQYAEFKTHLQHLIRADDEISLFEYALQRMVLRHLAPTFERSQAPRIKYQHLTPLLPAAQVLLSSLAHHAQGAAAQAFQLGAAQLKASLTLLPPEQCGLQEIDTALTTLMSAAPRIKRTVLEACAACVAADGQVTLAEAELLRAVADALDCPLPPILPESLHAKLNH